MQKHIGGSKSKGQVKSHVKEHAFAVTVFPNQTAHSKQEYRLTLAELGELIKKTNESEKGDLPWLKLCVFGTKRTDKNCLRSNANVIEISGIELDYDGKKMSLDEAVGIIKKTKLQALFYTSASYSDAEPKWRVVLPTSKPLPPGERTKLVARVNGVFGGIFDGASFTLSQAFYFGSVNNNPAHRVEVTDAGDFVDLRDDLDAGAIGKPKFIKPAHAGKGGHYNHITPCRTDAEIMELLELSVLPTPDGDNQWHNVMVSATASMIGRGWSDEAIYDATEEYCDDGWGDNDIKVMIEGGRAKWGVTDPAHYEASMSAVSKLLRQQQGADSVDDETSDEAIPKLMQTSAEFVAGFVPPDYLIDGLLQRRYVYSLTAPTGSGKTAIALLIAAYVAQGIKLAGRDVEKGRVLFFAGENPDDVRSRWIRLCEELGQDPDAVDVVFMPFTPNISDEKIRERIDAEAVEHGPFALLIVDTSASYYSGDDENDNVALGNHARMLRTFIELPGGPTVLVTCHPTKTPNMESLLPRGGGAFLAEVDGNLVCVKDLGMMTVTVTTHGKFRGPDFEPFSFRLVAGQSKKLVDSKGRSIWTIYAQPISDASMEVIKENRRWNQDDLLRAMLQGPGQSLLELAEHLRWHTMEGKPSKQQVHRVMMKLKQGKLVEQDRGDRYVLTPKGKKEVEKLPEKPAAEKSTNGEQEQPRNGTFRTANGKPLHY